MLTLTFLGFNTKYKILRFIFQILTSHNFFVSLRIYWFSTKIGMRVCIAISVPIGRAAQNIFCLVSKVSSEEFFLRNAGFFIFKRCQPRYGHSQETMQYQGSCQIFALFMAMFCKCTVQFECNSKVVFHL